MQMLMAESAPVRALLVETLSRVTERPATESLAQLALFDLHPGVRERAIDALKTRPSGEYLSLLLRGFEHPWPGIADHAAEALVALQTRDAVPALLRLLDRPDPQAPYQKPGSQATFIKEMVRVNHHLNCLLCHAASFDSEDKARGLVPRRDEPLSSGAAYYSGASPDRIFVRADVTYLKQDFSTMLPVAKPEPWPALQRFDFFVRERYATPRDLLESADRQKAGPSEQHKAIFFALRELTDLDPGSTVAAWKKALLRRPREVRLRHRGFASASASALAVDGQGHAYVVDGKRILRLEGDTKPEEWLRAEGTAAWSGLATARDGRLLATRWSPADVGWVDPFGKAFTVLASDVGRRSLAGPRRMAADAHGGVYFSDGPGSDGRGGGVLYLSARGTVSRTNALPGRVHGLAMSPKGETLYIARGAEVMAYPVESAGLIGKRRSVGRLTFRGGPAQAMDLAVDDNGLVYVLNGPAQEVEVFGAEGAKLPGASFAEAPVACVARGGSLHVLTRRALYTVPLVAEPVAGP